MSCPVRGTWIEMARSGRTAIRCGSCPVRGTWIEINIVSVPVGQNVPRRAPYGARGLKYHVAGALPDDHIVVPRTGHVD